MSEEHPAPAPRAPRRGRHHRRGSHRGAILAAICITAIAGLAVLGAIALDTNHSSPQAARSPASIQTSVTTPAQSELERSLAAYSWADSANSPFHGDGASVLLVQGAAPRAALAELVPHPGESRRPLREVQAWAKRMTTQSLHCATVSAARAGSWAVVVQRDTASPVTAAAIAKLSRHGTVVAVADDDASDASFVYARAGRVIRQFDPVLGTPLVGDPLAAEKDIVFGVPTSLSAMARSLLVAERVTGVHLTRADVIGDASTESVGICG